MKYLIILISLAFLNCSSQKKECKNFKIGTFKYIDSKYEGHTIVRNDSIQIETNDKNDIKIITKIEWISNCKYILTYKDIENYPEKENVIGEKINVEIVKIRDNSYTANITSNATNSKIKFIKVSQ